MMIVLCTSYFSWSWRLSALILFMGVFRIARKKKNDQQQVNEKITVSHVRLIDQDGQQVGVIPTSQALQRALDANLDLVLISPNPDNPVARIMDYGKYRFERSKQEREARKKQKTIEVKEVGLKITTEEHDFNVKVRNAERFLRDGNRVKVNIRFRGREMAFQHQGYDVMDKFATALQDHGTIDRPARMEGRNMNMFLAPISDDKK